jgi:malate dehydrogenase
MLDGEYGLKDICIGVPVIIGRNGIEKIVELELTKEEKSNMLQSAEAIRNVNSLL